MERFEIKRLAPDNEAALLSVQQSQIWAFSSSLSCLKRHVMCTVCREWATKWWWWIPPSISLPPPNAEGSLTSGGNPMMPTFKHDLSLDGYSINSLLWVTSRDYLNGLTCHFLFSCSTAVVRLLLPPRLLCRFGKAALFQEVTFYFICLSFFLSYSGFPRVSRGGRKEKKIRNYQTGNIPFFLSMGTAVYGLLLAWPPYEWVGFQCLIPFFFPSSVSSAFWHETGKTKGTKTGASHLFPFGLFMAKRQKREKENQ